jgi:N-acetylglucosaminyldiphosphoundecaprenol N-acetyl-beta-D-mannosaminyltransferase
MKQAIEHIETLCLTQQGGFVVTPNVDHVCMAETDAKLREAYRKAALSLVDGTPLLWLGQAMGEPFPEKISGSDLVLPLMQRAAEQHLSVYFLGGQEHVGPKAKEVLLHAFPKLRIVGMHSPPLGFEKNAAQSAEVLRKINEVKPHILLVALGCPKQEKWMLEHQDAYAPAVALGIGATLDFIAGVVRRSPAWMSRAGLEWVYRLVQEPKRMAERYLVRDRAIVGIAWRMLRMPKTQRLMGP